MSRPHISEKYIDFLRKDTKIKIIYYGHDLHFLREEREYKLSNNKETLKSSKKYKKLELDIIKKSDLSYYPSIAEIEFLKNIDNNLNVKVLPPYMFDLRDKKCLNSFKNRKNLLFVGGFIHRPNYDAMTWFLDEIFPKILEKVKDIKIIVVGSNIPEDIKKRENNNIVIKGFLTDSDLGKLYLECKMVIVPLRYGAGIKGKVVEAMYNGVPVVTTEIGIEGLNSSKEIAIIANESNEFASKVVEYYDNNEYLEKLALNGIKYINENYTYEVAKNVIETSIKEIYKL